MPEENRSHSQAGEEANGEGRVTRLVDLLIHEISLVDHGANRKKWVVRKQGSQEDDSMAGEGPEVFESPDGTLTTAENSDGTQPEADNVAKEGMIPEPVKAKMLQMAESAASALGTLIQDVKGAEGTDEDMDSPVPDAVAKAIKNVTTILRGILSRYPSPIATSSSPAEKTLYLPSPVKAKLLEVMEQASNRLASVIMRVKEMEVTSEDVPKPLPEDVGKEIKAIADLLDGLMAKYPSPSSASATVKSEEKPSIEEAYKLLTDTLSKVQSGEPVEESVVKSFQEVKGMLGDLLASARNDDESNNEVSTAEGSGKEEQVDKRGAKLSSERFKRFQKALKILVKLFDEVIPEAERGSWPSISATKSALVKALKEESVNGLEKRAQEAEQRLEKAQKELKSVQRDISRAMSQVEPSNVSEVETSRSPMKKDGSDNDQVVWPSDLNRPDEW